MKRIYKAGRKHLHQAFGGDVESLSQIYSHRTALWRDPSYVREIPPSLLFIDFLSRMPGHVAFKLVPVVADWVLSSTGEVETECAFWLLLSIAESSSTTEIPEGLQSRLHDLNQKAIAHGDPVKVPYRELLRQYRLDPNAFPPENAAEQLREPEL